MKTLLKIFKIIGIIILVIIVGLVGLYLYADNAPTVHKGYNDDIETGGSIEEKYLQNGAYEVKTETVKAEDPIKKYTIYYPSDMESGEKTYPMVLVVNGTGFKATKYEPVFEQMASWGFIVVGTQDKGTGTGETTITTLNYMLSENENSDSLFYQKIDVSNIGVTGFSQGGAGAINAVTAFEESSYFKTIVALSPLNETTAEALQQYPYDITKVNVPIFMLAGTSGEFETETVLPIAEMNKMYDRISSPKIMARRTGMTHDDMMSKAGGYVTAWFMWQLQGDEEAAKAFIGENPEISNNQLYQDYQSDLH